MNAYNVTFFFLFGISINKIRMSNKKTAILAVLSIGFIIATIGREMIYAIIIFTLLLSIKKFHSLQ